MGHTPQELVNLIDIDKYPTLKKNFSYIKNNLANLGQNTLKQIRVQFCMREILVPLI